MPSLLLSRNLSLAEVKSCCQVAYRGVKGDSYRFPDRSIWKITDSWATRLSGFKAILIRPDNARIVVLSFAGTDSIRDGIADLVQAIGVKPIQYYEARHLAARLNGQYPERLYLTGHSLGGGLAAYCSVELRLPASTINPAPLVGAAGFSAWFGKNSQISNYIAGGREVVSSLPGRTPGTDKTVAASGNYLARHKLINVAPQIPMPDKL